MHEASNKIYLQIYISTQDAFLYNTLNSVDCLTSPFGYLKCTLSLLCPKVNSRTSLHTGHSSVFPGYHPSCYTSQKPESLWHLLLYPLNTIYYAIYWFIFLSLHHSSSPAFIPPGILSWHHSHRIFKKCQKNHVINHQPV